MATRADPAELAQFREVLADLLGLTFPARSHDQLAEVLRRRSEHRGLTRSEYLTRLSTRLDRDELAALAEELTINETYFFRHTEQLRALAGAALPARVRARAAERQLRLLSVGCASGEEAYTLAMLALEAVPDPSWQVRVLGVDIHSAMLRRAVAATYSAWSLRETPPAARQRWFQPYGHDFQVAEAVRQHVVFQHHNITEDEPVVWRRGAYDVIFCRNVLMYLRPEAAEGVVARMTRALAPGGFLFLGHTDSLGGRPSGLRVRHSDDAFYYQRPPDTAPPSAGAVDPPGPPGLWHAVPAAVPGARPAASGAVQPGPDIEASQPARWREVLELVRQERFAEALGRVAELTGAGPDGLTPALLRAFLLAQTEDRPAAEAACRALLGSHRADADAHHLLAMCAEDDDPAGAAERYRLAATLDPDFAMPWLRMGVLARRRGDPQAMRLDLERAIALLASEREQRILLFGGGFGRQALRSLCRAELDASGARR
ncbi:CheR family methyltransferase [Pilimelia columellifera]|uniref:Protein-glutamate O-methyltransferase CheR n=1 Tax=Pilimelia columellifera subsp. columellifera TaxID=706583 RepID=A0ABP6AX21_9ACTN